MNPHSIGLQGEQIATDYLLASGFTVLYRNYRVGHLETDIIAETEGKLHFVEVKTRSCPLESIREFAPEYAVTTTKKERLIRAAEHFIVEHQHTGESLLSLIAINISGSEHELRYYPDIRWF